MNRNFLGSFVIAGCVVTAVCAAAGPFKLTAEPNIAFTATGVAGLKINGATSHLTLVEDGNKLTFTAPTTDFKTGIGLRDRHLKEHIEAEKFPEAKLVIDRSKVALPDGAAQKPGTVRGDFTLHGVSKPVDISYGVERGGAGYHVKADFDVNLPDYKIQKPCYMGICVGEKVHVAAAFDVQGG
jgi:polyisoprenoid-binding protein YceI